MGSSFGEGRRYDGIGPFIWLPLIDLEDRICEDEGDDGRNEVSKFKPGEHVACGLGHGVMDLIAAG